jgi:Xaa-Pro aminopeptidase
VRALNKKLFDKVDALFIANTGLPDLTFNYFTQLPSIFGSTYLIVKPKRQTILTSFLDYGAVKKLKNHKAKLVLLKNKKQAKLALLQELKGCKRVGFNGQAVSKKAFPQLKKLLKGPKLVDCSDELEELRAIKSKIEIKKLRRACKISLEVLAKMENKIKPGKRESEIALELDYLMRKSGAENTFPSIVASGKNAGIPHHITSDKKIRKGEMLLIDFGARYKLYGSDITRTYSIGKVTVGYNPV